ncbi:hypothetical protein JJB07_04540 [Tumebacillus sp. ITR2]|uniref:Uncharacterized protein n=1 Tax=Tumebacillus amylolyticus TaxID=2801339 RepID=A0ABS1J6S3_9BACL|nr:hypothetical protein [Tumebacillus amylolyticus]MBL0385912.1 hypothetical protein [Tumebacillus amylolyticus]
MRVRLVIDTVRDGEVKIDSDPNGMALKMTDDEIQALRGSEVIYVKNYGVKLNTKFLRTTYDLDTKILSIELAEIRD